MNVQEASNLLKLARASTYPHEFLIQSMARCKDANELAVPLCAYTTLDSNAIIPNTPMFQTAQTIIDNAIHYQEQAFLHKLGVLHGATARTVMTGELTPRQNLCTDYDVTRPSDQARKEFAQERSLRGSNGGMVKSVLKRKSMSAKSLDRIFDNTGAAASLRTNGMGSARPNTRTLSLTPKQRFGS